MWWVLLGVLSLVQVAAGIVTALKGKWGLLVVGLVLWPAWLLGALRLARPGSHWARRFYDEDERVRAAETARRRRVLAIAAVVAGLALLGLARGTLKTYVIRSSPMEPTLRCERPAPGCTADDSDRVLAVRYIWRREPERGNVVFFTAPPLADQRCGFGGTYVKRVVALPGETWRTEDGFVYVNGERLAEPYVRRRRTETIAEQRVPTDHYVVLADNRPVSCDSRVWGPLPSEQLIARVLATYWPPDRIGGID